MLADTAGTPLRLRGFGVIGAVLTFAMKLLFLLSLFACPLFAGDSIPIINPSFQADNFPTFPGYLGGGNPTFITGWTGGGINGTDIGAGTPFASNGAIPDGTRVAFIQGPGALTQNLTGFVVGQKYWVQVWMNARDCCGDFPKVNVSLAGQTLLAPTGIQPVGGASPYIVANFVWTATTTSGVLSIGSAANAGGDASSVFDAVAVIRRGADEVFIANPSFEASGVGIAYPGYYPNIAGWEAFGAGQSGVNTSSGPFHDNGIVPDGANVLLLQQARGVRQSVAGLGVGGTYRLSLRYNSRAATAVPTFRVMVDGQTAFHSTVPPVGAGQAYRTLTFDFTASAETASISLENMAANGDDTVLVDAVSLITITPPPTQTLALPQPGAPGSAGGVATFNEIHYNPAVIGAPEWVEIVNQFGTRLDLSGWKITGGIDFTFPDGTTLEPGAFVVVSGTVGNPAGALGPFTGKLDGAGETIRLRTRNGWLVDEVKYGVAGDWPSSPDGTGPTLAKRGVTLASDTAASWTASSGAGGTPGTTNFPTQPVLPTPPAHVAGSVVINEIFYHAHPVYADPNNAVNYSENTAEWVELHNRTAAPVDISGWALDDAISYTFPAATTIPAGGFLVVNNAQFSGSLANSGDSIKLRDTLGAQVDKVRYRNGGRWSPYVDGGGTSLELIDPDADNTQPESWAASDESAKLGWQTYTYTALGAEPPGSNNPSVWKEFLIGLLNGGEVLIDDISVRKDPTGANTEVIQNGTFESDALGAQPAKWRCFGTHKLSTVVQDPTGPGKVLRIVATDALEHTYNNCSTTLVGNQAIDPTKNYRVSFRAKWIAGSPQLHTRLYLNRAARTTILPQPAVAGTPGAVNSRRIANAGPTYTEFVHSPLVPAVGQATTVYVRPFDPDGLGTQTLFYSVNGGAFSSVSMTNDGSGRFSAQIPGQPMSGMVVQFYVQGADGAGAVSAFPPGGSASRALYRVGDGGVSAVPLANKIRLIMRPDDAAAMHAPIHSVSNFRWPATLIANDREVFYGVRVRLRSAPYGRQGNRVGWNLDFDPEQPFRGTETDMVLDGAFNMPRGDGGGWLENTLGPSVNEMLFLRVSERAGNIPSELVDVAYVATPHYESRRAQLRLRRYSNTQLDEFTPAGGDGTLFKQEIIYHPTTTVDGNPESLKNPYSTFTAVDIGTMGTDKESYRFNYLIQNHTDRDDYSGILAMTSAFSQPNANLYTASEAALDLESWTRTLALNALLGLADTYNQHLTHNIQFLTRPDGRVMLLPWDMDHAFYFATNFSIYGGDAHRVRDLIADARVKRRIAGHIVDLCNSSFSNAYLDPWVDHYSALAGKPAYAPNFKSWITARRASALAQVNTDWPATAFAISTNGGAPFSVSAPGTTLTGTGWVDVQNIRISGALEPLAVTWLDGSTWQAAVPLGAGANNIVLEATNLQGAIVGADSITITNIGGLVPAAAGNIVISELMYHPANATVAELAALGIASIDADQFEFLELLNTGTNTVDLKDATFGSGITYTFPPATLAPGSRLILVRNATAFAARYPGVAVFGTYTGGLSNGGERILLLDRGGLPIVDFTYLADATWPPETDGAGFSLTLKNPASSASGTGTNWRVSSALNGSPANGDALNIGSFAGILDYALAAQPTASIEAGFATFTWKQRIGADSATITAQLSPDLTTWNEGAALVPLSNLVNADGTRTIRIRSATPAGTKEFFRVRVVVPEQ
ncbi:MAG: hypothetical protein RL088_2068 [Verrucomicrobiota bacterium]